MGATVATVMGGMGRAFDGGYADYAVVPALQVRMVHTKLPWSVLGGLPEMLQTAWGALFRALRLVPGERLLIRGGTTSVGMAATAIAKLNGAEVATTSRRLEREKLVRACGADHFIVDDERVSESVRQFWPGGADKVLELVGTVTLEDSLRCVRESGIVCMAGMVGNKWTLDSFAPMDAIPTCVSLTSYSGDVMDFMAMPLDDLVDAVENGRLHVRIGRVYQLDEIVEAHRALEGNSVGGKIVVLTRASRLSVLKTTWAQ